MITDNCDKRILVCTPSNSAVDEIVLRLSQNKNFTTKRSNLAQKIVRVGAFDYEPLEQVKKHTLDYCLEQLVNQPNETEMVDLNKRKLQARAFKALVKAGKTTGADYEK